MHEFIVNVHNHTRYSDGSKTHRELALAAGRAGIDAVVVTDHNLLVKGLSGYYPVGDRNILIIVGEEIHDRTLMPQKNHLLAFGITEELSGLASNTQNLITQISRHQGVSFIAHPFEDALALFNETDITWENWQVSGYTGIELWNGLSELKTVIKSKIHAVFYALFPAYLAHGPNIQAMQKWDGLLNKGCVVSGIGGTDSHELSLKMGPLKRKIFPYEWHYQTINNHLILNEPLSGEADGDISRVVQAFSNGNFFIGYDLPMPTTGFRFYGSGATRQILMGEITDLSTSITLQISLPSTARTVLYRDGVSVAEWMDNEKCTYIVTEPGVYRCQCFIRYLGKERTWIISNPIYIREKELRTTFSQDSRASGSDRSNLV